MVIVTMMAPKSATRGPVCVCVCVRVCCHVANGNHTNELCMRIHHVSCVIYYVLLVLSFSSSIIVKTHRVSSIVSVIILIYSYFQDAEVLRRSRCVLTIIDNNRISSFVSVIILIYSNFHNAPMISM